MNASIPEREPSLAPWQAQEREDFLKAVARHQRLTWRISAVCLLAYIILALVMSLLFAPLLYCLAGLALDLLNLLTPMPDLLRYTGNLLGPIIDKPESLPLQHFVKFIGLACAPGLLLMALLFWMLKRTLVHSALFSAQLPQGRLPTETVLAEQRFANTIEEMSIAALISAPKVFIVPGGANAAAAGIDQKHACILLGEELLKTLDRSEMQGVAAHLVASIANNDMRIGLRTASLLGLFALIARLTVNLFDKQAFDSSLKLIKALLWPTQSKQAFIAEQLADPFSEASSGNHTRQENLSLRDWLTMPLMGPLWTSGFLGGLVNSLLLSPAIAFAWRQRKFMADATAVRLTREPNTLYKALDTLQQTNTRLLSSTWASHLCVVEPGKASGMLVSVFPPIQTRMEALVRMGASSEGNQPLKNKWTAMPLWTLLLLACLSTVAIALIIALIPMLIALSTMLTGIFTLLPAALLHALLRSLI